MSGGGEEQDIGWAWRPIAELSPADAALGDAAVQGLAAAWGEAAAALSADQRAEARGRLGREWGIETGVIEGLYVVGEGAAEMMIAHGLDAALIAHDDNGKPPELVIDTIADHVAAVDWLFDVVAQRRALSVGFVRELHAFMCRTQSECAGVDAFGNRVAVPLHHGVYKRRPNNPTRPDGLVHEYCPPEHVATEMDRLIALNADYKAANVPAEVRAAWLHHRFVQIHPFEDGNGRVGRAVASLALIEQGRWPLTVPRGERVAYITAFRDADDGDLAPLVSLVGALQRRSLLAAFAAAGVAAPDVEAHYGPEMGLDP
ncbi:MAG: Fic family protein [bacterium]|nr:Fic family protein [bacterium]